MRCAYCNECLWWKETSATRHGATRVFCDQNCRDNFYSGEHFRKPMSLSAKVGVGLFWLVVFTLVGCYVAYGATPFKSWGLFCNAESDMDSVLAAQAKDPSGGEVIGLVMSLVEAGRCRYTGENVFVTGWVVKLGAKHGSWQTIGIGPSAKATKPSLFTAKGI